nr:hypothetical protein [uncultured Draconibacterium sp.]
MGKDYNRTALLSHFPNKVKDVIKIYVAPPYCEPTYDCRAQYGVVYLINKYNATKDLNTDSILYKTEYIVGDNIIINLTELKRDIFPVKKCNKWHANKLPIPYFESYDFKLGEKEIIKNIDGETHVNYIYNIPTDLQVYVVQAEAGDFWKISCNEKRPESLKEWKHGYSKGYAISKKENLIVYWTMLW